MEKIYSLKGMRRKYIEVYENKVDLIWDNSVKTILIKDIVSADYAPCKFADGYLFIRTASDNIGTSSQELDKAFANMQPGVTFRKDGNEIALTIKNYLEKRMEECANDSKQIVQQVSPADELKKFKDLLDMGVITQDEFDAKKKQLLGI